MTLPSPDGLQIALTATTLAGIWLGWVKVAGPRIKPAWGRLVGSFQAIAGRGPIVDKVTGKEVSPAVKPIGEHLSLINDTMAKLVVVIESNQNAHERIDGLGAALAIVKSDVTALQRASDERTETARAAAEMLRLVGERDTIDGESTEG